MYVIIVITLALIATTTSTPILNINATSQPDWTSNSSVPNITTQDWTSKSSSKGDDVGRGLCRLKTTNPYIHNQVHNLLTVDEATLVNYVLNFSNYSHNPLTMNMGGVYDARRWSRVTTAHGQTLLSLAFNYGVLSMMTLTLGTQELYIELQDMPPGCFADLSNQQKVYCLRQLVRRKQPLTAESTGAGSDVNKTTSGKTKTKSHKTKTQTKTKTKHHKTKTKTSTSKLKTKTVKFGLKTKTKT